MGAWREVTVPKQQHGFCWSLRRVAALVHPRVSDSHQDWPDAHKRWHRAEVGLFQLYPSLQNPNFPSPLDYWLHNVNLLSLCLHRAVCCQVRESQFNSQGGDSATCCTGLHCMGSAYWTIIFILRCTWIMLNSRACKFRRLVPVVSIKFLSEEVAFLQRSGVGVMLTFPTN